MNTIGKVAVCGAIVAYIIYLFVTRQDMAGFWDEVHKIVFFAVLVAAAKLGERRKHN